MAYKNLVYLKLIVKETFLKYMNFIAVQVLEVKKKLLPGHFRHGTFLKKMALTDHSTNVM